MNKLFSVENKVAVVTGGSGILGSAMAKGLLDARAKVVLLGTNKEKINQKIASFGKTNGHVFGLRCDVVHE
ncbi:MAG: SDR family NAD(P)-dependent oxidoreductase, partial [Bacteroidota bacterium]|nr:SDR family NAD(P)-dependent oxidoreductase [Bacteroidota bacterium]